MPEAELRPCTVRSVGEHHYVVVDDRAWNVSITQADVEAISDTFENHSPGQWPDQGIWDILTTNFGDPPDNLDQDGKIYLLYYEFDVSSDGYFWYFDQYCDGTMSFASNECDVIYLNCGINPPAGDYMLAVAGHEFQHMIHFNYDQNEALWVEEGCGELAMWMFGHPDSISSFNNNPDNSLTIWNGSWADYIKTYLWTLYVYEQFGGTPFIRQLVAEPANGIAGYEVVLADMGYEIPFAGVFANWTVANYLDDPSIDHGQYGYNGEELPPFRRADDYSVYPVMGQSRTVNAWAADYAGFTRADAIELQFDGADDTLFAVHAITLDNSGQTVVQRLTLDALQRGASTTPGDGDADDQVVAVFARIANGGGSAYSFNAFSIEMTPPPVTPTPATPTETPVPSSPTPTATTPPSPTVTPTLTPSPVPTTPPTPEPTYPSDDPAYVLRLNSGIFQAGDPFVLEADRHNPWTDVADVQAFIALDVYGSYWFWPSWRPLEQGVDWKNLSLPARSQTTDEILAFIWPADSGAAQGICFHAIFLSSDGVEVFGDLSTVCFDVE